MNLIWKLHAEINLLYSPICNANEIHHVLITDELPPKLQNSKTASTCVLLRTGLLAQGIIVASLLYG